MGLKGRFLLLAEEASQSGGSGSSSSDRLDLLYRDVLSGETQPAAPPPGEPEGESPPVPQCSCDPKQSPAGASDPGPTDTLPPGSCRAETDLLQHPWTPAGQSQRPLSDGTAPLAGQKKISASQPIGSLGSVVGAGPGAPLSVCGPVEPVPEEEIRRNRETEAGIRSIPRFQNYQRGAPSEVRVPPCDL